MPFGRSPYENRRAAVNAATSTWREGYVGSVGVVSAGVATAAINQMAEAALAFCNDWWTKYPRIMAGIQAGIATNGAQSMSAAIAAAYQGRALSLSFPEQNGLLLTIRTIPGFPFRDAVAAKTVSDSIVACAMSRESGAGQLVEGVYCEQWWQMYPAIMAGIQSGIAQHGAPQMSRAISAVYLGSDLALVFPQKAALAATIRALPGYPFGDVGAAAALAESVVACALSRQPACPTGWSREASCPTTPGRQTNMRTDAAGCQRCFECEAGWMAAGVSCAPGNTLKTDEVTGCQQCVAEAAAQQPGTQQPGTQPPPDTTQPQPIPGTVQPTPTPAPAKPGMTTGGMLAAGAAVAALIFFGSRGGGT